MSAPRHVQRYYGVASAAAYLDLSPTTIRDAIRESKIPARRSGAKVLIDGDDLDAFFASLPEV